MRKLINFQKLCLKATAVRIRIREMVSSIIFDYPGIFPFLAKYLLRNVRFLHLKWPAVLNSPWKGIEEWLDSGFGVKFDLYTTGVYVSHRS